MYTDVRPMEPGVDTKIGALHQCPDVFFFF